LPKSDSENVSGRDDTAGGGGKLWRANKNKCSPRNIALATIAILLVFFYSSMMKEVAEEGQKQPSPSQEKSSLSYALANTPIGSLGPKKSDRRHLRYYDSLFYTAMQFGSKAKNAIEVGCGSDPFLQYITWIPQKICVAPYFAAYNEAGKESVVRGGIQSVLADFMDYKLPKNVDTFDLLICTQVLEHVDNPKDFMQKLIRSAKISIISVPYNWNTCDFEKCGHKTHKISYNKTLEWSYPYVPIVHTIVEEKKKKSNERRIILVFERDDV